MDAAQVKALATELETTLGLLGDLIAEFKNHPGGWQSSDRVAELVGRLVTQKNLAELPAVLLRAHAEISEILGGIRLTREGIEAHAIERIRDTKGKLSDVTSATESATIEMLNGLDRSLELINTLESQARGATPSAGFESLRGQVSTLYNLLQFQDITAQQLQGVGMALLDLETRVSTVAALFDRALDEGLGTERHSREGNTPSSQLAFNPDASMKRSRADQAAIDAAFKGARHGHASEAGYAARGARP